VRIWHAVLFGAGVIVFLCCRSFLLADARRLTSWTVERTSIQALATNTEVLFIGSSHVAFGINPALFDKPVAQLASGALDYLCMERVLGKALPRLPRLRLVVIEADIFPLRADTIDKYRGDYRELYLLGLQLGDLPRNVLWKAKQYLYESPLLYPFFFCERLTPQSFSWGHRRSAGGRAQEWTGDVPGYVATEQVISEKNAGPVILGFHRQDLKSNRYDVNLAALLRMCRTLESSGIRIALLRLPHHESYWRNRPAEWDEQYAKMIGVVTAEFAPAELDCWDMDQSPLFTDRDFMDAHHLNSKGARQLAEILNPLVSCKLAANELR
jgi:hypothetical protein